MADQFETQQALTQNVLKHMLRGRNIEQTAAKMNISPADVFRVWQGYVQDRLNMSWEEQWLLHLLRLENLLDLAHDVLESSMSADDINALLGILAKIEELQNLNLSRKKQAEDEMVSLTKAQVEILFQVMREMKDGIKAEVEAALEKKTVKAIKGELLDDFEGKFMDIQRHALEAVSNAEPE